jgi:UDP-glucose 4-epimerase
MSKVVIFGGSGFIGSHVAEELVRQGHEVTIYDRVPPKFIDLDKSQFTYISGDTRDKQAVLQAVYDHDKVIHLAGLLGTAESFDMVADFVDINITGSVNVFEAIRKLHRKGVYIAIGNSWLNAYTITKEASANFALMYNREFGTKITVVRGLNVYGPRQKWFPVNKYFPRFCVNLFEGKKIPIFGNGEQKIDMVHVVDTAKALVKAIESDFGPEQYSKILDAGTGHETTVKEAVKMVIAAHLDKPVEEVTQEEFDKHVDYLPLRPGEPENSRTVGDVAGINEVLEFVPTTDLNEGIREAYNWYKANHRKFYENGK